jgi:restriction system protein
MQINIEPIALDPKRFEQEVEKLIQRLGANLQEFRTERLEVLQGTDGEYEIDVTARFEASGGANFLVVVECKHHKNAIKREVVQVLYDRVRAVGAHKGMIFSTVRFQKGAIEYAQKHGIALVLVADGRTSYVTASDGPPPPLPPWVPPYVGWMVSLSEGGNVTDQLICDETSELLSEWLNAGWWPGREPASGRPHGGE